MKRNEGTHYRPRANSNTSFSKQRFQFIYAFEHITLVNLDDEKKKILDVYG